MGLKDLNEELYKRDGLQRQSERSHQFDAGVDTNREQSVAETFQQQNAWNTSQASFFTHHKKAIRRGLVIAGVVVVVALSYFVIVRVQQSAFSSDRVTMSIDGPSDVSGSESSRFVFTYVNANRADLTDVELVLTYPDNFHPDPLENMAINGSSSQIHITKVAGHSQGKVELSGKFSGSKGTLGYIKGVFRYKPDGVGSSFQTESQLGITIQSSSIKLALEAPLSVSSGGVVEYRVDYTNMSDVAFDHLRLKVEYPDGFHSSQTDPKASEGDDVWYIGNLIPGQTGSVRITGTMDGSKNEAKIAKAHIGVLQGNGELLSYSNSDQLTKIVASPLFVQQTVNGLDTLNVNPGTVLRYTIRYRNDSEIGLRNVIITLALNGKALDFTRLQSDGGAFDSARNIVTWKASDVRDLMNLNPGKDGSVSVSVPVLENISLQTDSDKNFIITSIAKIDSPDIVTPTGSNKIIGSNTMNVKVNSGIGIGVATAYQDSTIPNTGANPPQLGQETTYTIHWNVSNTTNDVDKAVVTAYLPTGIRFTGKTTPSSENITYDNRTNQITWNVGTIQNGVGSFKPLREVAFQIGLTPQVNQVGQVVHVLEETTLTAHDLFTNESLQAKKEVQTLSISR